MPTDTSRYFIVAALVLLLIVAGYVVVVGAALQVVVLLAPVIGLFVLVYLAIRVWTHSRARP